MSMLLVAAEIVAYLIVAAALGFVSAWALRGALQRQRSAAADRSATAARQRELELQLAQRDQELAALQQRLTSLEQATHTASAELLKTEHYGEIPRFLEQLGIGAPRAARAGSGVHERASGNAFTDAASGSLFEDEAAPPQAARASLGETAAGAFARDDLKRVHGIGPKFERLLNGLGVHSYKQIAQWSQADIHRYARELRTFPERVQRDDWVRSAREQHLLKYGERL